MSKYKELLLKKSELEKKSKEWQDKFDKHRLSRGNPALSLYAMIGADINKQKIDDELLEVISRISFIRFKRCFLVSIIIGISLAVLVEIL